MKFMMVGVDHNSLSLDERGYFHFRESDKLEFSRQLETKGIKQSIILSTCNRSEVYAMVEDETVLYDQFTQYFNHQTSYITVLSNQDALRHLIEVACGLQSMVLGEDQILHQIKDAMYTSMKQSFTGKELNYIFQNTIGFSKRMKHKYAISENPLSIAYIGYLCLLDVIKPEDTIMICGSGEMSRLMLKYLVNHQIYLVNRTYDKVKDYLNEHVIYIPFEKRYEYLKDCNVVISATSSPHLVFNSSKFTLNKPMIFLDLAIPRDIDPLLKENKYAKCFDMDDIKKISQSHLEKRQEIAKKIQLECEEEVIKMEKELSLMKNDSMIQKMQQTYLDLSSSTYELLVNKLDLNSREKYILKKVLNTQFLRLMKEPIQFIKNKDEESIKLIEQLYIKEKEE